MLKSRDSLLLGLIILISLVVRSFFGILVFGTNDTEAWLILAKVMDCGYRLHTFIRYPYPPLWETFIRAFYPLEKFTQIPYYYLIKIPPIIADALIIYLIYLIALQLGYSRKNALYRSLFYAISSVSLLITSFHGQFDSITLFFVLLAIYLLQTNKVNYQLLSAVSLGLSAVSKPWTVILIPLFAMRVKGVIGKLTYLLLTGVVIGLSLIPYLILDPGPFIRDIFLYGSTRDLGLAVLLDYFSINKIRYFESISNILSVTHPVGKLSIIIGLLSGYFFCIRKKISPISSTVIILLVFYSVSTGVGAQYLYWIIPLLLLSSGFMAKFYSVFATVAIIASYYWHNTNAFTVVVDPSIFIKGKFFPPWGASVTVWWFVCILILIYYLINWSKFQEITKYVSTINLSKVVYYCMFIIISGFILLLIAGKLITLTDKNKLTDLTTENLITNECSLSSIFNNTVMGTKVRLSQEEVNSNVLFPYKISLVSVLLVFTLVSLFVPTEKPHE